MKTKLLAISLVLLALCGCSDSGRYQIVTRPIGMGFDQAIKIDTVTGKTWNLVGGAGVPYSWEPISELDSNLSAEQILDKYGVKH